MDNIIRGIGKVIVWVAFGLVMFLAGWIIRAVKARRANKTITASTPVVKEAEAVANA